MTVSIYLLFQSVVQVQFTVCYHNLVYEPYRGWNLRTCYNVVYNPVILADQRLNVTFMGQLSFYEQIQHLLVLLQLLNNI